MTANVTEELLKAEFFLKEMAGPEFVAELSLLMAEQQRSAFEIMLRDFEAGLSAKLAERGFVEARRHAQHVANCVDRAWRLAHSGAE